MTDKLAQHQHARFAVVVLGAKFTVSIHEGLPSKALQGAQEAAKRIGRAHPQAVVQIVPCGSAQASFRELIDRAILAEASRQRALREVGYDRIDRLVQMLAVRGPFARQGGC